MENTTMSAIAALSPHARMQAGLEELTHIATRLSYIGRELNDVVVETTDETARYKSRITELEARDMGPRNSPRNSGQSDAEHKLKLVRRAMLGLLQELGPDNGSEFSPNPGHHRIASVPSTQRSVIAHGLATPRTNEHRRRRGHRGDLTSPSSPMPPPTHSSVASPRAPTPKRNPSIGPQADPVVHPASNVSQSLDTTLDMPRINLNDDWRMATGRAPRSAYPLCPIPFAHFEDRLHLDEDTMLSLESLAHSDDLSFHVQIVRNMAFVYEPIAMDGPATSILFDFGNPTDNKYTAEYIKNNLPGDGIFHTFTFPPKKDTSWYYIGALKWSILPPIAVWQTLSERSRKTIVKQLCKQCNSKYNEDQLRQMLQEGELETFCVQVSSTCKLTSETFAATLGYASSKAMRK